MKMGRRLRCSGLRINFDIRPPRALPAPNFDRNESYAYFGDRTLVDNQLVHALPTPLENLGHQAVHVLDIEVPGVDELAI